MMLTLGAIITVSSGLGYLLPAIIGLESMGIPSPGETALVLASVLASQGKLHIWLVIVIGVGSAIVGDNIGYWLGRKIGRDVLERPGPLYRRRLRIVAIGDRFYSKHGAKAVFIGRWIALVRFAAAWMAGINEMRVLEFFFWNALGAITWGLTYGLVGYYGGKGAAGVLSKVGIAGAVILVLMLIGGLFYMRKKDREESAAIDEQINRSYDPDAHEPS